VATGKKRLVVYAAVSLLLAGALAGCGSLNPGSLLPGQPGPSVEGEAVPVDGQPGAAAESGVPGVAPVATRASSNARTVPVKRDTIAETLMLDGLVAPREETTILFPGRATIAELKVKGGDTVYEGDVLLEIDSSDLKRQLEAARAQLQTSITNLTQAHAQSAAQRQATAQRALTEQQVQQLAVADANTTLRHAQENLAKVQAGASAADKQTAQTAVDTAMAALVKAQQTQEKLVAGPDQEAIKAAQRELTANQVTLAKAQADANAVTRGPDPAVLRDAQAQVTRAQNQLQIAQATQIDPKAPDAAVARIQREGAIHDAQLALQAANEKVAQLKQPPASTDVQAAKQRVQDAEDAVNATRDRLALLQEGANQGSLDAAQAAVASAQWTVDIAQANLSALVNRPTRAELADAQDQVRKAQAGVEAARRSPGTQLDASGGVDLEALQQNIEHNQSEVWRLEQAIEGSVIRAPFDGTVVSARVKAGDAITSNKPLLVLAKPGAPIINIDLSDSEAERLAADQAATVQFETVSGAVRSAPAAIQAVKPAAADGSKGPAAVLGVTWQANQAPRFGTPVQVAVTVQQKQDALVVPKQALRQTGDKITVMVMNGSLRRLVDVQVGITTDTTVEILSGLAEGQLVLPQAI
jgi:multidrug efflux pump subunit AcrA (membrane-fusion protein)